MPEDKWVFDTVALSNFLLSDSTYLLEKRYAGCGIITREVYDELSSGMAVYPELRQVGRLIETRIFELLSLSTVEHTHYVEFIGHLGKGEASCIALANHRGAIIVTDDRTARKRCMRMNLQATGTIGILKASLLEGDITLAKADDILHRMIKSGFYSPVRNISDIV
jgi:predicted nucleic acid-binding protein